MDGYKHYLRVDDSGIVIYGFSDAFEQPQDDDVLYAEDAGRHFQISLTNERGQYKYKWKNGQMAERSQSEIDAEWDTRPPEPPTEVEKLREEVNQMTILLGDLILGGV